MKNETKTLKKRICDETNKYNQIIVRQEKQRI